MNEYVTFPIYCWLLLLQCWRSQWTTTIANRKCHFHTFQMHSTNIHSMVDPTNKLFAIVRSDAMHFFFHLLLFCEVDGKWETALKRAINRDVEKSSSFSSLEQLIVQLFFALDFSARFELSIKRINPVCFEFLISFCGSKQQRNVFFFFFEYSRKLMEKMHWRT